MEHTKVDLCYRPADWRIIKTLNQVRAEHLNQRGRLGNYFKYSNPVKTLIHGESYNAIRVDSHKNGIYKGIRADQYSDVF
jgi:hypothetical protein